MGAVEAVIRDEIAQGGTITVARFMELALYHPFSGYYRQSQMRFGHAGDFYTGEQLQPVFGELVASYAERLANSAGLDFPFSILELGAGRGEMRTALSKWNYRGFDWNGDPLPAEIRGLVLANEFFDALPVHLLRKKEGTWCEVGVGLQKGKLSQVVMPATGPALLDYAHRYGSSIPERGQMEVCLDAAPWLQRLSGMHIKGNLLVIDYGYSERELARLQSGTLMAYRRHHASADFLADPGNRDITAHVNFSYLKDLAISQGYRVEADSSLRGWITRIWDEKELSVRWRDRDEQWRLQWKQLFAGMGETFRVLELGR